MNVNGEWLDNITCKKCRNRHPAQLTCKESKRIADEMKLEREQYKANMKQITEMTREDVITNMCYTWRHDYGLDKSTGEFGPYPFPAGMTQSEREFLYKQMAQIFDNDIAPYMEFKE